MRFTDEDLMAYVDGEMDDVRRASLERELSIDSALAQRISAQQRLRERMRTAFDGVLDEPVPVTLLKSVARNRIVAFPAEAARRSRRWQVWMIGTAAAAGVVLGVMLAPTLLQSARQPSDLVTVGVNVEAGRQLADALSRRLVSEQKATDGIRLGVSFLANTGAYCRTFTLARGAEALSGMACHEGETWRVRVLQSLDHNAGEGAYRQAASSLPPLIRQAVEDSMVGEVLDATGELRARDHGWRAPITAPH